MFYPIRIAQFMALGYSSFGKKAFETNARAFTPDAIPDDLGGRHIVVTGGTSGIGKAAVRELAARHATVHLVCRDSNGGEQVRKDILSKYSDASVHVHTCDISSLSDIARLADEFQKSNIRIRALVNNAGSMLQSHEKSADGLEANFATNTLGVFAITEMLRPFLDVENGARVITVSSGGMLTEALEIDDLGGEQLLKDGGEKINGERQYARCKRHQVAMTEYWARKYSKERIFWATMHPGWVDTPGVKKSMPKFYSTVKDVLRTPEQGADTMVYLSTADEAMKLESGGFFFDRKAVAKHLRLGGTEYSEEDVDRLVQRLRDIVEDKGLDLSPQLDSDP